jgi:MFS family permease
MKGTMLGILGGATPAPLRRKVAFEILIALTAINLLNYLDRYVLSAVLEQIKEELVLGDAVSGVLGSAFMVVYMLAAPICGYYGDRVRRNRIAAIGIALWSLATLGTGFAQDYPTLLAMRALVGIGEAGYATVAPSIIADLFEPDERGRRLALFYLAIPVGSALGYLVGGWVGENWGWRSAFFVAGGPGLLFALVAAFMPEPPRGAMDRGEKGEQLSVLDGLGRVFRSPAWRINTAGMAMMTFAIGGLAFWMPSFFVREHDLDLGDASMIFGGLTVVGGFIGTFAGGYLGDRAQRRSHGGYFRVSGIGLLLGAPFALAMPFMPTVAGAFAFAFMAELLLFLNTGPLNAALVASVPARLRASAVAINVFFIHLLGDAFSPTLIGVVSDLSTLSVAVAMTSGPIALGGVLLLFGARKVARLPRGLRSFDGEP